MLNDLIVIENIDSLEKISCWACREKTVTTEEYINQSYKITVESIYKIRNTPRTKMLGSNCRLVHMNKTYNIENILKDEYSEFIKIECKRVI